MGFALLDTERGVSALKRIKPVLRGSLRNPTLDALIRISQEGPRRYKPTGHISKRVRLCTDLDLLAIVRRFRSALGPKIKTRTSPLNLRIDAVLLPIVLKLEN